MKLAGDLPTVLLSVEIGARELDSKLALACALAGEGCRVIVAQKPVASSIGQASQRIVFLGKDLFSETRDIHPADRLIANGSAIMFLQDEGGIFQARSWEKEVLQKHQVDKVRSRDFSRICLWGGRQAGVLSAHAAALRTQSRVTGSPRFDICAPEYEWTARSPPAANVEIDARYILACTRFTAIAHAEGPLSPFRRKLNPRIWPDGTTMSDLAQYWLPKWQQDVHDFADFVVLIRDLAMAWPHFTIVVRPHPSESLDFYRSVFEVYTNVVVVREGSALDWIRRAELVLHSNCTTGIEAAMAGRRVVNFLPDRGKRAEFDIEVASEAGTAAHTIEGALRLISDLLSGDARPVLWSDRAGSILNNLNEPAIPLLVRETADVLRERGIDSSRVVLSMERAFRSAVRRIVRGHDAYAEAKLGRFDAKHIELIVDGCRSMGLGRGSISHLATKYAVIEP